MQAPSPGPGTSGTEPVCTWSATYVPPGTPMRHRIDTDDSGIRLIIGGSDQVELAMEQRAATEMVSTLQQAIREFHAPPAGPDAA